VVYYMNYCTRLVLVLILSALSGSLRAQNHSSWLKPVRTLFADRNYSGAARALEQLLPENQKDFAFLNLLGATLERNAETGKATAYYQKALEIRPQSVTVRLNLAINYVRLGQNDRASKEFIRALKDDSTLPAREPTYQQSPDDEVMRGFVSAVSAPERDWYELGTMFLRHGRLRGAQSVFEQAAQLFPHSEWLQYGLGRALQESGKFQTAREAFTRAREIRDPFPEATLRLGYSYFVHGEYAESIRIYEKLLESQPDSYEAHYFLALSLARRGTDAAERSLQHLRRAVALNPQSFDSRVELGRIYFEAGKLAEARNELELAVRLDPGQERVHYFLAQVYARAGQSSLSQIEFRTLEELKRQSRARAREVMYTDLLMPSGPAVAERVLRFVEEYKAALFAGEYTRVWEWLTPASRDLYENDAAEFARVAARVYGGPDVIERLKRAKLEGGKLLAGRIFCEFTSAGGEKIPPLVLLDDGKDLKIDFAFEWTTAGLGYLGAR
jgi:tetratricopeptide (TPR) repeat protein